MSKSKPLSTPDTNDNTTHFGFSTVGAADKQQKVGEVFHSVAQKYDIMNDVMSAGMHRVWKRFAVDISGVKLGDNVLDIAGGSGDLSKLFAQKVGAARPLMADASAPSFARGLLLTAAATFRRLRKRSRSKI